MHSLITFSVCKVIPSKISITIIAPSTILKALWTSSKKLECPGVSIKLNKKLFPSIFCNTKDIGELFNDIFRFCSSSLLSKYFIIL